MANQKRAAKAKYKKKSQPKVRSTVAEELSDDLADLAQLPGGPITIAGDGTIQAQAALLSEVRLQGAQRRALAAQIGQVQGNRHLQRVVASLKRDEKEAEAAFEPAHKRQESHPSGDLTESADGAVLSKVVARLEAQSFKNTVLPSATGKEKANSFPGQRTMPQEMIPGYANRFVARPQRIARQPIIQFKKIEYQQLTWDHFEGKAPTKGQRDAQVYSRFHEPERKEIKDVLPVPKSLVAVDTKEKCTKNKKKTVFKVDIRLSSKMIRQIKVNPYMDTKKSWRKSWVTDDEAWKERVGKIDVEKCKAEFKKLYAKAPKEVTKVVRDCKKWFRDIKKRAKDDSETHRGPCQEAVAVPRGYYTVPVGGTKLKATNTGECNKLVGKYRKLIEKEYIKQNPYPYRDVEAATPKDCSKRKFKDAVEKAYKLSRYVDYTLGGKELKVLSKVKDGEVTDECEKLVQWSIDEGAMEAVRNNLLKHEQGHFDITKLEAYQTRDALLKTIYNELPREVTGCGRKQALKKAKQTWAKNVKKLEKRYKKAEKDLMKRQDDYDTATDHGQKIKAQKTWTKAIGKELEEQQKKERKERRRPQVELFGYRYPQALRLLRRHERERRRRLEKGLYPPTNVPP